MSPGGNVPFNIADLIEYCVDAVPDREAIADPRRRVTYAEFDERANRLAHHLAEHGVGPGNHVGIYAENRVEFVETMFAALKLRAVPINVNYRYVPNELRYVFDNADLVALVVESQFIDQAAEAAEGLHDLGHFVVLDDSGAGASTLDSTGYEEALETSEPDRDFEPRTDDDHYVIYTGGTTGMPKGVVWRHEDVFRTLGGGIDFYTGEPVTDDHFLARRAAETDTPLRRFPVPPLMHGAAQWMTFQGLFAGEPVYLTPKFDPHEVWKTVEAEKTNIILVTGDAMARPLADALEAGRQEGRGYDTSSLISFSSSAAVFSPAVKDKLLDLLGDGTVITDSIGSSESGFGGMTIVQKGQEQKGGPTVTAGPDALVLDDDLRPIEPGSGEVGRVARGGNVPIGYYNDPEKTAETFVEIDGKRFVIPGDFATIEADGTISLLGRGSMCINTGGEKVFPEEVEATLKSHPDVFDVLVVGVDDERWGQRVTAVVEPRPGTEPTLEQLDAHCRAHIAGYKVPRELHLVPKLERLPSGKPDYPWAKDVAAGTERV